MIVKVEVELPPMILVEHATPLIATAFDHEGEVQAVPIEWTISDLSLATITHAKRLLGLAEGEITVTASAGGVAETVAVFVRAPARYIQLTHGMYGLDIPDELWAQNRLKIDARAVDTKGRKVDERHFVWSSSHPDRIEVDDQGNIFAKRGGEATVRVDVLGLRKGATIFVKEVPLTSLHLGYRQICGLSPDGAAHCMELPSSPMTVPGDVSFKHFAPGQLHTCGLTEEGEAYCFGNNARGALGTGDKVSSTLPVPVNTALRFSSIYAGRDSTCAISTETGPENTYCWGWNAEGHLGLGEVEETHLPMAIQGKRFTSLSHGTATTCGIDENGKLWCWGDGSRGQLGNGTMESSDVPVPVATDETFSSVSVGNFPAGKFRHVCALTLAG